MGLFPTKRAFIGLFFVFLFFEGLGYTGLLFVFVNFALFQHALAL
jgi:hypothetical protein